MAEGFRWLWGHPPVRTLALVIVSFNITFGAAWSVLVLYATDHLGMGDGRVRPADHRRRDRWAGAARSTFGWLERECPWAP